MPFTWRVQSHCSFDRISWLLLCYHGPIPLSLYFFSSPAFTSCLKPLHSLSFKGYQLFTFSFALFCLTAWVGGFIAISVISFLSLLGVILVPLMNRVFFKFLLSFLVALAVGTLSGDAFLHLLPHVSTVIYPISVFNIKYMCVYMCVCVCVCVCTFGLCFILICIKGWKFGF